MNNYAPTHKVHTKEYIQAYYKANRKRILEYQRAYNKLNKERITERNKRTRRNDPATGMFLNARIRAAKKGVPFSITVEDIHVPEICPIKLIPLCVNEGKSGPNSPTLDRIINDEGYVPGNVRVISKQANTNKSDMTLEDVERLLAYMLKEI